MRDFEHSIEIDAPPEVVWAVIRDVTRWLEWTPTVTSLVPLDDGLLAVGHRYRVKQPKFPPTVWRVTAIEAGRGFTWVSGAPGMRVFAHHAVTPVERGARATLSLRFAGALGGLLGRMTRDINRRYLELEAAGLKRESEARATR